jgi:hypothetical protein
MTDPLTAGAIATLVLTKAFEKNGEKVTEAVWSLGGKLLRLLKQKAPDTAGKIEQVAATPSLAQTQPADYGEAVLIEAVEKAAIDPDIKAAIETLAALAQQENASAWTIENWKGINIKGGTNTVSGNTLNF